MSFSDLHAGRYAELDGHADEGPSLRHGAAGSRLADHADAVPPQLYSGCTARQQNAVHGPSLPPFPCTSLN